MHLAGYFYETYHDAWSPEHKMLCIIDTKVYLMYQSINKNII